MKKLTEKYETNLKKDLLDPAEAAEYLNLKTAVRS
jgi:hypothetical protein